MQIISLKCISGYITKLKPTSSSFFRQYRVSHCLTCYSTPLRKMDEVLKPPDAVRGLIHLDKQLFEKNIEVSYLALTKNNLSDIIPIVKKYLLKLHNLKPIQHIPEKQVDIYLNPKYIQGWSSFPSEVQTNLKNFELTESNLRKKNIILKYDNFTAEDIFQTVLPVDKEGMSSFTKVGHIVHVNLRDHLLPYKQLIGEVLYDKISGCRSVVNKINMIDNTYRNFKMEVLKGDSDMVATVKENNCTFKFDFSTVYWNSRLCTEHERIVKKLKENDVLFDVFAGVGPFSIPAAKRKCYVYANDLNPESFKWLNHNAKANKIKEEYFESFNKDGRDFIKQDIKKCLPGYLEKEQNIFITMNLPALAVEFLDSFVGLFKQDELPDFKNCPLIFVYCFAKGEDYSNIARNLVINNFGIDVSDKIVDLFRVRTVSSLKEMMRITVRLDRDILVGNLKKRKLEDTLECDTKRINIEGESLLI